MMVAAYVVISPSRMLHTLPLLRNVMLKRPLSFAASVLPISRPTKSITVASDITPYRVNTSRLYLLSEAVNRQSNLRCTTHSPDNHVMLVADVARVVRPRLSPEAEVEIFIRMIVAILAGAIVGVERRAASATAGIRTLTLVSLGAAIFSLTAVHGLGGDPARMGAAISTGIGFLGSGAINGQISGSRRQLVTAASIWVAAALGVAAATGLFRLAITGAFITIWVLRWRLVFSLITMSFREAYPFIKFSSQKIKTNLKRYLSRSESDFDASNR